MENLTKTEERIMHILWRLRKAFVKHIIEELNENPKPPYNTISSVIRLLEKKGFVGYKAYGKTYEYYPIVSKLEYRKACFRKIFSNYFDNSIESLVSYIVKEENIEDEDLEIIRKLIEKNTGK